MKSTIEHLEKRVDEINRSMNGLSNRFPDTLIYDSYREEAMHLITAISAMKTLNDFLTKET